MRTSLSKYHILKMNDNVRYRFANQQYINSRYNPAFVGKKTKARYYVWMISSFAMIIFIGIISGFIERCRNSFVFSSYSFKSTILFFLAFIISSFIALRRSKEHKDHIYIHIWREQKFLAIVILLLGLCSLSLFTYSIYPAYEEASIVFLCLGAIFLTNIGCIILYD